MGSGVVGVVVTYWPSRRRFLPEIIQRFQESTVQVDELIVWNNHPDILEPLDGATVINSGGNYTSRAKYAAAIVRPSPYYLLVDDDIAPRRKAIEYCLKYAEPGCCFAFQGFQLEHKSLSAAKDINGLFIKDPEPVDAFLGVMQFLSIGAIGNMVKAEEVCRVHDGYYLYDAEDILIAMANDSAAVLPVYDEDGEDCGYTDFKEAQVEAMKDRIGYFPLRDDFTWKAWKALGNPDLPGPTPGVGNNQKLIETYKKSYLAENGPLTP
jgi:hypothetical protein